VVASPLYKQHYDLRTGQCLESPEYSVQAHQVLIDQGQILVAVD
jgi:nitrite reductase (NADH) small subunit